MTRVTKAEKSWHRLFQAVADILEHVGRDRFETQPYGKSSLWELEQIFLLEAAETFAVEDFANLAAVAHQKKSKLPRSSDLTDRFDVRISYQTPNDVRFELTKSRRIVTAKITPSPAQSAEDLKALHHRPFAIPGARFVPYTLAILSRRSESLTKSSADQT